MKAETIKQKQLRLQILNHLKQKGIKLKWLADNIDVSVQYISQYLKGKDSLTEKRLTQINLLLETSFEYADPNDTSVPTQED